MRIFSPTLRARGFTLLEVIIATVIMAITLSALLVTFRTGIHAWDEGHGMSEIMQSARISQEVMLRDLNNMVFADESNYNRDFRQQLDTLATQVNNPNDPYGQSRLSSDRPRSASSVANTDPLDELDASSIAPPIDLTFSGEDGGKTDKLTFARHYVPRLPTDPATWGLRRVSYYVKDGTLYRQEADPFGFSPGEAATKYYTGNPALAEVASQFMKPRDAANAAALAFLPLPLQFNVAEPLCDGVEMLNITYGYFQHFEWLEVNDWDSGSMRYRNPPDPTDPNSGNPTGPQNFGAMIGTQNIAAQAMASQNRNRPDELPGYMAVQLGVRPQGKKGRLYSFTFYYNMPLAQETDIYADTGDTNGRRPPTTSTSSSSSFSSLGGGNH